MSVSKQLIDIINKYEMELESSGFLQRAYITNQQLVGAIKTFAKGVNPDAILGMIDNSLNNSGVEGILWSTSAIYFSVVDVPNYSVKHAMLRYEDILQSHISQKKLSDFSSVAQIDIKNLPYEYYRITSLTVRKTPFVAMLNDIADIAMTGESFEADNKPSIENVKNYLHVKDEYMLRLYSCLAAGEKVNDIRVNITDSMGLTPMHYCITMMDEANANRIIKKTIKYNADMYIKNQPYGIYNYCMDLIMAGGERDGLFYRLFLATDEMATLEKKRKITSAKETTVQIIKDVGQALWDNLNEQSEKMQEQRSEYVNKCIDQQTENVERARREVEKDPMKYSQLQQAQMKLDRMKAKADELLGNGDESDYEEFSDYSEDENIEDDFVEEDNDNSYEMSEDDYSNLINADMIASKMIEKSKEYFDECCREFASYETDYENDSSNVDPRFPIIKKLMKQSDEIGKRIEESDVLLNIKFKYFLVPQRYIDEFPKLKQFVCEDK